jgi:aspartate kinase
MALIVQKYGGTSVGSIERIRNVARRVARYHRDGHQLVVVVSAMAGETNRLLALARDLAPDPNPRELDVIAATGEQVTIGLLAIALDSMGHKARSYTGGQIRVLTDSAFTKARILAIDEEKIRADLDEGTIVIVAGFQGVDADGNITTLGRGGSDTSGVALAAALKADECQIYTRCRRRLYDRPPDRSGGEAARHRHVRRKCWKWRASDRRCCRSVRSSSPASTTSSCGCCRRSTIPIDGAGHADHVRGRRDHGTGDHFGIAFNRDEAKISLMGVEDRPGIAYAIVGPIAAANVDVDMIVQNIGASGTPTSRSR